MIILSLYILRISNIHIHIYYIYAYYIKYIFICIYIIYIYIISHKENRNIKETKRVIRKPGKM